MNRLTREVVDRPACSIFLFSLLALLLMQYKPAILNYTTRFVDFTQYALHHGLTLFPIADDLQPYPDYTIANTLLQYLASLPFGRVSILSMGLPFCLAAALILVLVYKLGALHDKRWGVFGVLFTLFSWSFVDGVTYYALDVYPALVTVACFYLVYSADMQQVRPRLHLVMLALALGFAFRGPVGLIGPTLVIATYYSLSQQWRRLAVLLLGAGAMLALGVALLVWAAWVEGGQPFVDHVLEMQGLGRVSNVHSSRYYFYFTAGLATYGVSAFYAVYVVGKLAGKATATPGWTLWRAPRHGDAALLFHLAVWVVTLLLLFTIPDSKKNRYVLSIAPAIGLLAAYIFVDRSALFSRAREGFLRFCWHLPVIGLALLAAVHLYNLWADHPLQPNTAGVLFSCTLLALGRYGLARYWATHPWREALLVIFGLASFLALDAFLINTISYHQELAVEPTPKYLPFWFW
ncbi:hypothetical protein SFA35_13150 [Pseudomonas sp. HR96]|uniref:ArnT family glycosyltransferase n=1 Tax=Pseudomonas sp. HR96 TaxID=1027966 RepID=UPI002A74BCF2|nr:hypothetical protein [Pseudomonas sp. HR96]WPO97616.1 hypothetical protein SFA35_13150 [Pseudomonas sp. HR96]